MLMELQQLKYFKTVADIGKISEAAEALLISAPALSTSISRLEKELGFRLFDRTNNRIILNAQGKILLKYANQIFSTIDDAARELQDSIRRQGHHISITCVNTAMWVNLITAFTSEYPDYTLSCSTVSVTQLSEIGYPMQDSFLLASEADIPASRADDLEGVFLFESYPAVMVHKDHPLAKETSVTIRMLANERIFMPTPGFSLSDRIIKLFHLYDLPLPAANSYSYLARRQMVSQNLGASFLTMYAGHTPHPNLCCIPLEDPFGPWRTYLYWRKNRALTQTESVFKDFSVDFTHSLH